MTFVTADVRAVVVVGSRRRGDIDQILDGFGPRHEVVLLVLGLRLSAWQRRIVEKALEMSAEKRFTLTAELVAGPSRLREYVEGRGDLHVFAGRREVRRFDLSERSTLAS